MKKKALILGVLLAGTWAAYTSCGSPSHFTSTNSGITIVGNPLAPASSQVLQAVCAVISRCNQNIDINKCSQSILNEGGFGPALGLASFTGQFSSIMQAEVDGTVTGNNSNLSSCTASITTLACSSTQVQQAYNSSVSDPYASASALASASSSCSAALTLAGTWTWMLGSNLTNQKGVSTMPGARASSDYTQDKNGVVWMFGGLGVDLNGDPVDYLNDFWKWDGSSWTLLAGGPGNNIKGTYGVKGTAAPGNYPGSRETGIFLQDSKGNFWMFGGQGIVSTGALVQMNELWKFDGANWAFMGGSNTAAAAGVYGVKGTASASNWPGSRDHLTAWMDSNDNLWIFGGVGLDSTGSANVNLNDLWKYDTNTGLWTWVAGSQTGSQSGNYGTQGQASATNVPSARQRANGWIGTNNHLWLYGGLGPTAAAAQTFGDLWEFDGTNWIWQGGSSIPGNTPVYGTQNVAAAANFPGARRDHQIRVSPTGIVYLFGGVVPSGGSPVPMNDLWKFDPSTKMWTWISGSNTPGQASNFGTQGVPATTNVPGARSSCGFWIDSSNRSWVFGGDTGTSLVFTNDQWSYQP